MRLFYAIEADREIRAALAAAAHAYEPFTDRARWTRPDNLHLTVHFLGECDPAQLPVLIEILNAATTGPAPFSLAVSGAGTFGRHHDILWLGLAGCATRAHPLQVLYRQLQQSLIQAGLPDDSRPFVPHITIARDVRLKSPDRWPQLTGPTDPTSQKSSPGCSADSEHSASLAKMAGPALSCLPDLYAPITWPVTGLSLMHSARVQDRLTYVRLAGSQLYNLP